MQSWPHVRPCPVGKHGTLGNVVRRPRQNTRWGGSGGSGASQIFCVCHVAQQKIFVMYHRCSPNFFCVFHVFCVFCASSVESSWEGLLIEEHHVIWDVEFMNRCSASKSNHAVQNSYFKNSLKLHIWSITQIRFHTETPKCCWIKILFVNLPLWCFLAFLPLFIFDPQIPRPPASGMPVMGVTQSSVSTDQANPIFFCFCKNVLCITCVLPNKLCNMCIATIIFLASPVHRQVFFSVHDDFFLCITMTLWYSFSECLVHNSNFFWWVGDSRHLAICAFLRRVSCLPWRCLAVQFCSHHPTPGMINPKSLWGLVLF